MIEATYAAEDPPLLKRLREEKVPRIIDPQTQRFAGGRFLQVAALSGLPYAPAAPFVAESRGGRGGDLFNRVQSACTSGLGS